MTKTELSKLIMDYGDFRVEANTLDELRNYETELVNRLYEAINYSQCCKSDSEQLICEECKEVVDALEDDGCCEDCSFYVAN